MEKQQATLTQIERRNSGEDLKASDRLLQTRRSSRNKKRAEFIKHLRNGSEKLNPLVQRFRNKKYEEASRRGALITALQRLKSENKIFIGTSSKGIRYLCNKSATPQIIVIASDVIRYSRRKCGSKSEVLFGLVTDFIKVGKICKIRLVQLVQQVDTCWYNQNKDPRVLYVKTVDGKKLFSDIYMDQYKQSVQWLPFASPGYFNVSKYYECKGGMIYDTEDGRLCHAKAPFPSEIPFADLFCGAGGFTQGMLSSSTSTHKRKRDCDTPNTMKFSAALMVDSNEDALATAEANVDKETILRRFSISTHEEENKELAEILSRTVHSKYGSGMIIDGSPCQGLSAANATRERSDTRNLLYVAGGRLGLVAIYT